MTIDWFLPDVPRDWHDWVSIAIFVMMVWFKVDRGNLLRRNSAFMDRLWASTIAYDYAQAIVWSLVIVWHFYPGLERYTYRPAVLILASSLAWAWREVRRASRRRLERMTGDEQDVAPDRREMKPSFFAGRRPFSTDD
jgi:hypothetical protein